MVHPLEIAGGLALGLALAGSACLLLTGFRVRAFFSKQAISGPLQAPAVTVLKPLHGDEPGLEAALATFLDQDYSGEVQVVLGLQDPDDPARAVAERLREAHPQRDICVVIDGRSHGANRKVSNVINMWSHARHDLLVLADSDIVVQPTYLASIVGALENPEVGVVSCPYFGQANAGIWSRLVAMGLTCQFLPSVVLGVSLGLAHPCMGSTIALRRDVLREIGGFQAFADRLADDYAIGAAVRAAGYRSLVPPVLVGHGCAETSFRELLAHELRWAGTVRRIDPAGYAGSAVIHAAPLALLGLVLLQGAPIGAAVLAIAVACRVWMIRQVEKSAGTIRGVWWLLPMRDILSFAVFVGSFFVSAVEWRGARFRVDGGGGLSRM